MAIENISINSKDHGIEHYDICSVLACKPTIVEYGK